MKDENEITNGGAMATAEESKNDSVIAIEDDDISMAALLRAKRSGYKHIAHDCRVELTEADKLIRSEQLVEATKNKALEVHRHKREKEAHKAKIVDFDKDINRLLNALESGSEMRAMECYEKPNFKRGTIEVYRFDTGEKVSTRSMTKDEMQTALFTE